MSETEANKNAKVMDLTLTSVKLESSKKNRKQNGIRLWVKHENTLSLLPPFLTLTWTVQPGGSQSSEFWSSILPSGYFPATLNSRIQSFSLVSLSLSLSISVWKRQTKEAVSQRKALSLKMEHWFRENK